MSWFSKNNTSWESSSAVTWFLANLTSWFSEVTGATWNSLVVRWNDQSISWDDGNISGWFSKNNTEWQS